MRLHTHHDPRSLERALLDRLDQLHPSDGAGATLVVVPTARLVDHLVRRAARKRRGWLGLEIVHLRRLATSIVESGSRSRPGSLSPRLRRAVLRRRLSAMPEGPLQAYLSDRPAAVGRLLASLDELREAGVPPERAIDAADADRQRELSELYRGYTDELDRLAAAGLADDAALTAAATARAPEWARRWDAVLLHGLVEPVGMHLDLLRAIDGSRPIEAFFLADDAPAFRFAARRAAELNAPITPIDAPERPSLRALFDERASVTPDESIVAAHAQGPAAEVEEALAGVLRHVASGTPPQELAIVARGLESYATPLESALERLDLQWSGSLGVPLRRFPIVRDLLAAIELVERDFPRRETAAWLRSPRVDWSQLAGRPLQPAGEWAETWSREARLLGGRADWTDGLVAWADRTGRDENASTWRRQRATGIGDVVEGLFRRLPRSPRRYHDHARTLERLLDEALRTGADDPAVPALSDLLADLARLDRVVEGREVSLAEVRAWLEEAVDETTLPLSRGERGGVRVLDAMQARGLTFEHVFLIGLNAGAFPRPARDDPFLPDPFRRRLRERTGRPLPLKGERADEERWLLASLVGAGRSGLTVSWQRADESGRSKTPSMALREIARLRLGRPDLERFLAEFAHHLPSHPRQVIDDRATRLSLASPTDVRIAAALDSREADRHLLAERFPELASGIRMLVATQTFRPDTLDFDGRIGPPAGELPSLSVSAFERLGTCPRRFFFQDVLRVPELPDPPDPYRLEPREIGEELHVVLEGLYRELIDDGILPGVDRQPSLFGDDPDRDAPEDTAVTERSVASAVDEAVRRLQARRDTLLGDVGERLADRLPLLWQRVREDWILALEHFVRRDIEQLIRSKSRIVGIEERVEGGITLPDGRRLDLHGRFDRRVSAGGRTVVGDYKASRNLGKRGDPATMLKGLALQVPLYARLGGAHVELLSLHPDADPPAVLFAGLDGKDLRESFEHTLTVLDDLRRAGAYPVHPTHEQERSACRFCPFTAACRRVHPPTSVREEHAADGLAFRELRRKNTKQPLPRVEEAAR